VCRCVWHRYLRNGEPDVTQTGRRAPTRSKCQISPYGRISVHSEFKSVPRDKAVPMCSHRIDSGLLVLALHILPRVILQNMHYWRPNAARYPFAQQVPELSVALRVRRRLLCSNWGGVPLLQLFLLAHGILRRRRG
jgi:hypothetical protein